MRSWIIGFLDHLRKRVDGPLSFAKSSVCTRSSSTPEIDLATRKIILTGNPLSFLATSDNSFEQSHKVSQHMVWRNREMVATATWTPSASKRGTCIQSAFAVAVEGDALIHGPHLVAQPVGSEWRNHRPQQMRNQFKPNIRWETKT